MPDILVTTPRAEIENARKEAEDLEKHGGYFFRTFKILPKIAPGDRIYFVENGEITGFGAVFRIDHESKICESTGREWTGHHVCYNHWTWLDAPVAFKGFRGYRYINTLPENIRNQIQN